MKKRMIILVGWMLICMLALGAAGYAEASNGPGVSETVPAAPATPAPLEVPAAGEELLGAWYCAHDGIPVCLQLGKAGAYTLRIGDAETEGAWELTDDGLVLDGKSDAPMAVIGNDRILWAGAGEVLTREEVKAWEPAPAVREGVEAADFGGYWVSWYVESGGVRLPSDVVGDNSELYIDGERVALGGAMFGDIICDFTFADGGLTYTNSAAAVTLEMQEDLTLRCTVTGADSSLILYMKPGELESLPFFAELEPEA